MCACEECIFCLSGWNVPFMSLWSIWSEGMLKSLFPKLLIFCHDDLFIAECEVLKSLLLLYYITVL